MHSRDTLAYFCAPPGRTFWEWMGEGESGACIVWMGDPWELIAFRTELEGLLAALQPEGLPPLGSLLLVLHALRPGWNLANAGDKLTSTIGAISGEKELSPRVQDLLLKISTGRGKLHDLPAELTAGGPAREQLLCTLFEEHPDRLDPALSHRILSEFIQTPRVETFAARSPGLNGMARLLKDLSALASAFDRCPPEHLADRLRTGLDRPPDRQLDLPLPKPDELPGPESTPDLLRALENEGGELARIAGLTRRMSAILHVPKAVTQAEDLPVGGVSDITNRGDPSRLLLTELAWDDMTFAVRLSQGEALYLRRESPPAEPPPRRVLLLDTGIFMWGKPRLFALGAALSLLRQKHRAVTEILVTGDSGFEPASLDTVDDIRRHLARLTPPPHPGKALAALASGGGPVFDSEKEIYLLTHPDAFGALVHLPIWRKLAAEVPLHTLLIGRDGQLEMARHSISGSRSLARARVEAEDLFDPRPTAKAPAVSPGALTADPGHLPFFYRLKNWPLLHPAPPAEGKAYLISKHVLIGISTAGCVCAWPTRLETGRVILPKALAPIFRGVSKDGVEPETGFITFDDPRALTGQIAIVSLKTFELDDIYSVSVARLHGQGLSEFALPCLNSGCLVVHLDDHSAAYSPVGESEKIAVAARAPGRTWPVFDGAKFHEAQLPHSPFAMLELARPLPKIRSPRTLLRPLYGVTFTSTGELAVMTESGHGYTLRPNAHSLEWKGSRLPATEFQKLVPVDHPQWKELDLRIARFRDGRRAVIDPRGFLHLSDAGEETEEISITLVRGSTAIWVPGNRYYGDGNLIDPDQKLHPKEEILPLLRKLCRSLQIPTLVS